MFRLQELLSKALGRISEMTKSTAAVFVVHAADPIGTKEKALLFLIGFVVIAICGAGKYSLDRR